MESMKKVCYLKLSYLLMGLLAVTSMGPLPRLRAQEANDGVSETEAEQALDAKESDVDDGEVQENDKDDHDIEADEHETEVESEADDKAGQIEKEDTDVKSNGKETDKTDD